MTTSTTFPRASLGYPQSAIPKGGWLKTFYINHRGKRLGPYHVRCWKANGKLHRQYVKRQDLERVRAECQAYREKRKEQIAANARGWAFKRNWDFAYTIVDRVEKGRYVSLQQLAHVFRIIEEGWLAPNRPSLRTKFPTLSRLADMHLFFLTPERCEAKGPANACIPLLPSPSERSEEGEGPGVGVPKEFIAPDLTNKNANRFKNQSNTDEEVWIQEFESTFKAKRKKRPILTRNHCKLFLKEFRREQRRLNLSGVQEVPG